MVKPRKKKVTLTGIDALLEGVKEEIISPNEIAIKAISLPPKQPRRYFDTKAFQGLVASIKEKGILSPLLVRPIGQGKYQLVAGERRFRAAQKLELSMVPVVIRELDETEAFELALMENLQRNDLTDIEETEGMLDLLESKLEKGRSEIVAMFNQASRPETEAGKAVVESEGWQLIEAVCERIGINPQTFRTRRLPLLNAPEDIKKAMLEQGLETTKAFYLIRISDEQSRKKLTQEILEQELSLKEVIQRVKGYQSSAKQKKKRQKTTTLKVRLVEIAGALKKSKIWNDSAKSKRIEEIIQELQTFLED